MWQSLTHLYEALGGLPVLVVLTGLSLFFLVEELRSRARLRALRTRHPPESSPEPPAPEADTTAAPAPRALPIANLSWALFWLALVAPFAQYGGAFFTADWEALATAPGAVARAGAEDIAAMSPGYGLVLMALVLTSLIARIKAGKVSRQTLLRARLALMLVAIIGATVAVRQIAFLADQVILRGGVEIPEDDAAFRQTLLAEVISAAATNDFDATIRRALESGNVEAAKIYMAAAEMVGQPVSLRVQVKYEQATSWFNTAWRSASDCFSGAVLRNAQSITQLVCIVGFDLTTGLGDELDILRQGYNYVTGDEIDQLILALAGLGIAIEWMAGGNDSSLKDTLPGITLLKTALRTTKHMDSLKASPRLTQQLRVAAASAIDVDALARQGRYGAQAAAHAVRPEGLRQVRYIFDDLNGMRRASGSTTTPLLALKYADDLSDLGYFQRVARVFGTRADAVIEVVKGGWKRAFWKAGKAGAKTTAHLTLWYSALVASIVAFLLALSASATGWLVKGITMRWARRASNPSG